MPGQLSGTSVQTAQDLLSLLRDAKDEFRAVDTAVADHLRDGRGRVDSSNTEWRFWRSLAWTGPGGLVGRAGAVAVEGFFGAGGVEWPWVEGSGTGLACTLVGGGITGVASWLNLRQKGAAARAEPDRLCDDFLFAGVAVEVALGDLRTALDAVRRGRPGSAETLAARTGEAREAFGRYVGAVEALNAIDLTVRYPWHRGDVDVAAALQQLTVDAETLRRQVGLITTQVESLGDLSEPPRMELPAAGPAGGLDTVIATAEALRVDLAASGRRLQQIEDAVRRATRHATTDTDAHRLERLAQVVAEAHQREGFVEADCLAIENAASEGAIAETVSLALHHLAAAPSAAVFRNAFAGYESSVVMAAQQLASLPQEEPLDAATAAAQTTSHDVSRLTDMAIALATALDTVRSRIGQLATS